VSVTANKPLRIASIDVFRAITMFLMIFVNDLWTVSGVPQWLEHATSDQDMLGFADVIFPAFLFVMGMSIPLAIGGRLKKGESKLIVLKHIIIRTIALLVMGLFTVNSEYGLSSEVGINRSVYVFIMLLGFFLIWNVYPRTEDKRKLNLYTGLKIVGWIILIILFFIYKNDEGGSFQIHWWGILGLIGWAYFFCAIIYLFLNKHQSYLWLACLFFLLLCISQAANVFDVLGGIIPGDGCYQAFTMFGLLVSLLLSQPENKVSVSKKIIYCVSAGLLLLIAGAVSHSWWIISKIQATPTWLFLCTGSAMLFYIFIYWLTDMKGKAGWFALIKPAGTSTLTCYLIPYFLYALFGLISLQLPEFLTTGAVGLLKCFAFSFITIGITALLGKAGLKLKI